MSDSVQVELTCVTCGGRLRRAYLVGIYLCEECGVVNADASKVRNRWLEIKLENEPARQGD